MHVMWDLRFPYTLLSRCREEMANWEISSGTNLKSAFVARLPSILWYYGKPNIEFVFRIKNICSRGRPV